MSVTATDADDPLTENAALSYSIIGQESIPANTESKTMFGINNQTGTIYTRDVGLDREVNEDAALSRSSQFGSFCSSVLFSALGGESIHIKAPSS